MNSTRSIFPWLVLLTLIAAASYAGAESQKAQPRLTIEAPSFDFNEVKEGAAVEHTFRVVNNGEGLLRIKQIKTS
jgi:hypothetical protein